MNEYNQNSPELPMVVWLNGNESYFETFSLDADAAMVALGLKRSRLTQISGKELRVGRAKMGRYIRPVYRPCDLEAYMTWVKPTATHQKSSSVIQEAAQQLENQTTEWLNHLQALLANFPLQVSQSLGQQLARQTELLSTRWAQNLQTQQLSLTPQLQYLGQTLQKLHKGMDILQAKVSNLESVNQTLLP